MVLCYVQHMPQPLPVSAGAFKLSSWLCMCLLVGLHAAEGRLNGQGDEPFVHQGGPGPVAVPADGNTQVTLPPDGRQPVPVVINVSPDQIDKLRKAQEKREEAEYEQRLVMRLIVYVILHIPMAIFMVLYKWKVVDHIPRLPPEVGDTHVKQDFDVPLFYCFDDLEMCLYTFWCGACRVGQTMQSAGILEYYPVIFLLSIVGGRGNYCFSATFRTYFRHKLRQKLGIRENLPVDCLISFFCPCCAIAQEAKAVDQELGVTVGCCFDVKLAGQNIEGGGQFRLRNPEDNEAAQPANRGNEEAE